jgi:CheY-like chemotaxis protein
MNGERPVVLVVEDDPTIRMLLTTLLEDRYAVEACSGGQAALRRLGGDDVDLVLLDLLLPDLDGRALCQRVRLREAVRGQSRRLPIVMLTAVGEDYGRDVCLAAGADAYHTKPFDIDEVVTWVDTWLTGQ